MGQGLTAEQWRQHFGKTLKVNPPSNVAGRQGKLIGVEGLDGVELSLTLQLANGSTCRPFARYCELVDDLTRGRNDVQGARPQNKTQPCGDAVAAFFKGPTNYASCPKCRKGKLVPMFSGEALCDQACERSASKLTGCDEYWATGGLQAGSRLTLWEREDDARYWAKAMGNGCGLFRVRLLAGTKLFFTSSSGVSNRHPTLKGKFSSTGLIVGFEIEILEEVSV